MGRERKIISYSPTHLAFCFKAHRRLLCFSAATSRLQARSAHALRWMQWLQRGRRSTIQGTQVEADKFANYQKGAGGFELWGRSKAVIRSGG